MKTPTSILVMAILGIIYGGIIVLIMPCSAAVLMAPMFRTDPAVAKLFNDPVYMVNAYISLIVAFILGLMLLVGSIGALRLKPWARKVVLAYAWASGVVAIVNVVMGIVLMPRMEALTAGMAGTPNRIMSVIQIALGLIFAWVISGLLIYFYNRRIARDAFQGIVTLGPQPFPVELSEPEGPGRDFP